MINGNNQYWQNAAMNIRKDEDEWRLAKDTVSNTYTTEDEGKVVDNGTLVAQTSMPDEVTENGTIDTTLYNSVTVNVSGGSSTGNDVIFYDYDGTVVASYSAADFADLSAMPENPTHTGLTGQGWNWTLADAKTYVASYGKLDIGQMYITDDGKTRFYIEVSKFSRTIQLSLMLEPDSEIDVDWGDGSAHTSWTYDDGDNFEGTHEYASAGKYAIAVTVVSGYLVLLSDYIKEQLYKVELGSGVLDINDESFENCYHLLSITIPDYIVDFGNSIFQSCCALRSITIPKSANNIKVAAFYECYTLQSISLPNSVTNFYSSAFSNCYSLSSITIPNSVKGLFDAFNHCYSLLSITIPNSVTSIDSNIFTDCYALQSITFTSSTPPELSGDLGIEKTCIIRVPQGSLSAYTSAANYPDPSEYIYEEY